MKTIRALSLLLLLGLIVTPSCQKFTLSPDDLVINLELDLIKTNINIRFYDAATKTLIGGNDDQRISIEILGADKQYIIDPSGSAIENYRSTGGFLGLALDPYAVKPTQEEPIVFNIVAKMDGYVSNSKSFTIDAEGLHNYTINMVNIANPPDGVEVGVLNTTGVATNGILDQDLNVYTQSGNASFQLAQGTSLTDKQGNLLGGNLEASMIHFDPSVPGVLSSFPGGLEVTIENEDGQLESAYFVSAAFVDIEITDENNRKVEKFESGSLELDIDIDPNIINPNTGQHAQPGDEISIWSYNEDTGIWKFEGIKIIYPTPEGLGIKADLPHLSTWNLAWTGANNHAGYKKIVFKSPSITYESNNFAFLVTVVMDPSNSMSLSEASWSKSFAIQGAPDMDNELLMHNFPGEPLKISFTFLDNCDQSFWELPADQFVNLSTYSGDYEITLSPSVNVESRTAVVHVNCTNTGQRIKPTQMLVGRYRKFGSTDGCWIVKTFMNGETTVYGIEDNTTYEVQAYYQNSWLPATPIKQNSGTGTTVYFEPEINCI